MNAPIDLLGSFKTLNIRYLPLAAAIAATLITPIAQAQVQPQPQAQPQGVSAEAQADGRCMAAMLNLSKRSKGKTKEVFRSTMMFFLGKIVGRGGVAAFAPVFGAGAAMVNDSNADEIARECLEEATAIVEAM